MALPAPSTPSSRSPLRLDHAVVPVHDAALARSFYRDVLGLPLVSALRGDLWGGRPWLMMVFALGAGGEHLAVTAFSGIDRPAPPHFPRDARHVAFALDSAADWEGWKARVVAAKVEHWEEDHGGQRSLYVVDPSGNVLELATPASAPAPEIASDLDAVIDGWLVEDRHRRAAQTICLDFYERGVRNGVVVAAPADAVGLLAFVRARWMSLTAALSAGIAHADQDENVGPRESRLEAMQRLVVPALGETVPAGVGAAACLRIVTAGDDVPGGVDVVYVSKRLGEAERAAIGSGGVMTVPY
jgi:catechol 2,3-dioxygenase-like lactoylglutathione lyase family enzyme